MGRDTAERKADHLRISLEKNVQPVRKTTGFDEVLFIHKALPEIDRAEIDLSTSIFGHTLAAPLIVSAMTGGTPKGGEINATIAGAVEELRLGMGVGSQRVAMEDKELEQTFAVARENAPTAFLMANIGGAQLVEGYGLKQINEMIRMIDADAIAIHLNPLQEAIQPEGQTNFRGILAKIAKIAEEVDKPVIVKETGAGIAAGVARKLEASGVDGIDVSGAGGTSWAAVEYYRADEGEDQSPRSLGDVFWDWGIQTAASVVEVSETVRIPVIASGGMRDGTDVTKALSLGAHLAGISRLLLKPAFEGVKDTKKTLNRLIEEMKNTMFLVGAGSIPALRQAPLVIVGRTAEWLTTRGFEIRRYARRGE